MSMNKGGRIIIGWNPLSMKGNIKAFNTQLMHLEVTPALGCSFHCTFLYAATDKNLRETLFSMLELISKNVSGPCMNASDFNCVPTSMKDWVKWSDFLKYAVLGLVWILVTYMISRVIQCFLLGITNNQEGRWFLAKLTAFRATTYEGVSYC